MRLSRSKNSLACVHICPVSQALSTKNDTDLTIKTYNEWGWWIISIGSLLSNHLMRQPKLDWCQFTFWSGFICSIYNALWAQYQPPLHSSINGWATNKNINEIDVSNNIPLSNGLAITHTQQQNTLLMLGVQKWLTIIKIKI